MAIRVKQLQPAKVEAVSAAKAVFETYNDFIFANYRGLTVAQISTLRKNLSEKKAVLKVVKNTYARVAFEEMKIDNVAEYLKGPTAIILGTEDANEVAKILFDFAKEVPVLEVKGAFVDKQVYDAAKIAEFSKLPGKKQLIAMIASTINAPVQKLVATLQAYADKLQAEGGSVAVDPVKEEVASVAEAPVKEEVASVAEVPVKEEVAPVAEASVGTENADAQVSPATEEKSAE